MIEYEKLPQKFKSSEVKIYYNIISKKKISLFFKRTFDIVFSILILIILLLPIVIISILVKIDSKGSIFYRQERITRYGKIFKIYKFRTMITGADKIGSLVTLKCDDRITRVGKFLRKYRFDEIPQIFNIILGDMSFVGTRPEVKKYVDKYDDYMYATLLLPAGLTSYASINYKDEDEIISSYIDKKLSIDDIYINYILPNKMRYNMQYLKKFSFFYDLIILFKTFTSVFIRRKK